MEKVGAVESFPPHEMTEVELEHKTVLVVNDGDDLYVTAARCPHLGGRLAQGRLDGVIITCPLHGSQFDARTGKVLRWTMDTGERLKEEEALRPSRDLETYHTTKQDGFLYIEDSGT